MALYQNPFTLGGWQAGATHTNSMLTFRIVHPSAEAGNTGGPVDILNCTVLDPYGRRFLSLGTSIPIKGETIDPVTSIQDTKGSVVATVEWPSSGNRHPFVRSSGSIAIPRQALDVLLQATANPSMRTMSVGGKNYTWAEGPQEYKLYTWGDGAQNAELLVTVTKNHTGEFTLSVSATGLADGVLLLAILVLVVLYAPRR